jgi:aspartyl aminopeptidase
MSRNQSQFNRDLCEFLDASPTPFHAVSSMVQRLSEAGFSELQESQTWSLQAGGKYYVVRNGSSIIAFVMGTAPIGDCGLRMTAAHTDSPCLMLKPQPEIVAEGCQQLGVEVYGGALLNPWFDRDLSIAGRLVYRDAENCLRQTLVDFREPVAVIPSLAIHLDREANRGRTVNPQNDMSPLVKLLNHGDDREDFRDILRQRFLQDSDQVVDFELCLYDAQPAAIIGLDKEFLASGRLDNLLSCYVATRALIEADGANTCLMVCNDHEEVGSVSAIGADGPFLQSIVERIVERIVEADSAAGSSAATLSRSLMISCDNAHAVHPNYRDKHDAEHLPRLNGGPVIKTNVKQRYATNSLTASLFKQLCQQADVPVQQFVSRADLACGSTVGPIVSSRLGVATLDVGIPQLAMHSCRELAGSTDPMALSQVLTEFHNTPGKLEVEQQS